MGRRKKDEPKLEYYERKSQVFNPESQIAHMVFIGVSNHQKITQDTEKGTRVLVARYPDFYKIYFFRYIPVGSTSYPRGGVKVFNATEDQFQCFYYESVAIHPTQKGLFRFDEQL